MTFLAKACHSPTVHDLKKIITVRLFMSHYRNPVYRRSANRHCKYPYNFVFVSHRSYNELLFDPD